MNPRSGLAPLVIIAIGIVILGTVGYFVFLKKPGVPPGGSGQPQATSTAGNVDASGWKTYANEQYGFEVKYLGNWRVKPKPVSGFLDGIDWVVTAYATPEFTEDLAWHGGEQVFSTWFQNPKFDMRPVLERQYANEPQYYQYSSYNGAPWGIFVYVLEGATPRGIGDEVYVGGIRGRRIVSEMSGEFPEVWSAEKVELEKDRRLFLIFYAGGGYQADFDAFLSTFRFTRTP